MSDLYIEERSENSKKSFNKKLVYNADADEERRNFLESNWKERDLDILAADFDCDVEFHGINRVKISEIEANGEEWDRILVTGACQEFPRRLMRRLSRRGVGVVSVGPEGASLINAVSPNEDGGLFVESVTMWAADELDPRIYRSISDTVSSGGLSDLQLRAEIGEASKDNSYLTFLQLKINQLINFLSILYKSFSSHLSNELTQSLSCFVQL